MWYNIFTICTGFNPRNEMLNGYNHDGFKVIFENEIQGELYEVNEIKQLKIENHIHLSFEISV